MGRRKIEIEPITNDRRRCVTFAKRKHGLIKKATELSVLCDAQVAVMVFSPNQKVVVYSSSPIEGLLQKFTEYTGASEVYTNEDYFRERAAHKDSGASHLLTHNEDGNDDAGKANDPHAASSIAVAALPFASATTGAPAVAMQTAQALPTALSQVPQAAVYGVGNVQQCGMYGGVQASGVQQSFQPASGQPMFSTNGAAYQQSLPQTMCQDPMQAHAMASADPQHFAHMPQQMGQVQQQQMNAALAQMPGHMQMPVPGQVDSAQQMGQALSALHASQQMAQHFVAPAMAQTMPIAEATTQAVAPASYEPPAGGDATEVDGTAIDHPEEGSNKKARTDEPGF